MTAQLVIESGVPLPTRRKGYYALLRRMKRNQSLFMPETQDYVNALAWQIFGKGAYQTKKESGGCRVWRVR